jgi:hypothetical protein
VADPTLSKLSIEILDEYIFSFFCPSKLNNLGNVMVLPTILYVVFGSNPNM